jgi:hypothetical protein
MQNLALLRHTPRALRTTPLSHNIAPVSTKQRLSDIASGNRQTRNQNSTKCISAAQRDIVWSCGRCRRLGRLARAAVSKRGRNVLLVLIHLACDACLQLQRRVRLAAGGRSALDEHATGLSVVVPASKSCCVLSKAEDNKNKKPPRTSRCRTLKAKGRCEFGNGEKRRQERTADAGTAAVAGEEGRTDTEPVGARNNHSDASTGLDGADEPTKPARRGCGLRQTEFRTGSAKQNKERLTVEQHEVDEHSDDAPVRRSKINTRKRGNVKTRSPETEQQDGKSGDSPAAAHAARVPRV